MYAIIDIETTGGRQQDKITEIAIFIHNGQKIVDEFVTLINPEITIPYFITNLTGISNVMVANAPKFYEVAKKILELTQNKIFVAHNSAFDYNFIKKEFKDLGFDYKRDTLCTVKLARKLISGHKSYSLGIICEELGIEIDGRHRAAGDALATVKLFEHLMSLALPKNDLFAEVNLKSKLGSSLLSPEKIKTLPEDTGVYYFYDEAGNLIYIGKSKNIYKRVLSHLGNSTLRATKMKDSIADISIELTGSELVALLLEDDEIKANKPLYNRAQRRTASTYGIYEFVNDDGYRCLKISKNNLAITPITCFDSSEKAMTFLSNLVDKYALCQKFCGIYSNDGACFHHSVQQCNGACIGKENAEIYNAKVSKALSYFYFENDNFLIIDAGRNRAEKSVVAVKNGKYLGFGYIDVNEGITNIEELLSCIKKRGDNREVHQIILRYLRKTKVEKLIRF